MDKEVKIVIADDHQMLIDGIKALLRKEKKLVFVHEAADAESALEYISHKPTDLLITDISMPGMSGTELTKKVKQQFPSVKVLVLTMFNDPAIISDIIESEAEGYILKNTGKSELVNAITKIMDNGTYYSSEVLNTLLAYKKNVSANSSEGREELTPRELEILKLVTEEKTTAEIAEKLFISVHTVDTHRKNILKKTKCKTIIGLIKFAFENNLIRQHP
jgi:DNA-binding NarL/FixJ family response regulator